MGEERRVQLAAGILVVAGLGVVIGSFLPWMVVRTALVSLSRNGLEGGGDGIATVVAGVLLGFVGVLILAGRRPGRTWLGVVLVSGIALGLAAANMADVSNRAESVESELATAGIGSGLYLIALGALVAVSTVVVLYPSAHVSLAKRLPPPQP